MYVIPYVLTSYLVPCCRSLAVAGPARIASIVITELLCDLQFGTIDCLGNLEYKLAESTKAY